MIYSANNVNTISNINSNVILIFILFTYLHLMLWLYIKWYRFWKNKIIKKKHKPHV